MDFSNYVKLRGSHEKNMCDASSLTGLTFAILNSRMSRESIFHEYEVYLPVPNSKNEVELLEATRKELVDRFGGLTVTNFSSEGEWRIGPAKVRDQIQIWRILSEQKDDGDNYFRLLKKRLEESLHQQKILITRRVVSEIL